MTDHDWILDVLGGFILILANEFLVGVVMIFLSLLGIPWAKSVLIFIGLHFLVVIISMIGGILLLTTVGFMIATQKDYAVEKYRTRMEEERDAKDEKKVS